MAAPLTFAALPRRLPPPTRLPAVEPMARGDHADAGREDEEVVAEGGLVEVGEVQLDPLVPGQRGAAVDLRPTRDPRPGVEPVALALRVAVDLHLDGGAGPDEGHLAAQDVDEVRELVERGAAQQRADPRDSV